MNANSTATQRNVMVADVIAILLDRQWHRRIELIERLSRLVSPETARRGFLVRYQGKLPGGKQRAGKNTEYTKQQRALGAEYYVGVAISGARTTHYIETENCRTTQERIRLAGWYCWNCGSRQHSPRQACPDDGLCESCRELARLAAQAKRNADDD